MLGVLNIIVLTIPLFPWDFDVVAETSHCEMATSRVHS